MRALRAPLTPVIGLLVAVAWLALTLWATSPYARYLEHGNWSDIGFAAAICHALPAGQVLLPGLLYAGGWLLMTAAMMLPTTLPLLHRFERMTSARSDRHPLVFLLIAGYLLVWGAFGIAAHLLDTRFHLIVRQSDWLVANGWALGAVVLMAAGAFQFSPLKYRCLDQCRSPLGFITRHWRGRRPTGMRYGWAPTMARSASGAAGRHADDVRRRHREYRLDAGARSDHGGGKEHALGAAAQPSARCRTGGLRRHHCRRQHRRAVRPCAQGESRDLGSPRRPTPFMLPSCELSIGCPVGPDRGS